jgi:hypothetical protein
VPGVLGENQPQLRFAEDQHPVGDLGPGGEDEPFGASVRARTVRGDLRCRDAGAGRARVEGVGELPGAVADQEPEVRGVIAQVHQEIADLLGGPRSVRVSGDSEDVDVAALDFDDEQAVQAPECHCAVHMEEIGGQHRRGLGVQELPPCRVGVPCRHRRDMQGLEDPTDRGGADPVAELEQLALDALVSPRAVVGGELLDERGDLGADRRSSRVVRIGPLLCDQAAMPPQDGAGRDQPVRPQRLRQDPDQRGQHRPVGPVQPRTRIAPP